MLAANLDLIGLEIIERDEPPRAPDQRPGQRPGLDERERGLTRDAQSSRDFGKRDPLVAWAQRAIRFHGASSPFRRLRPRASRLGAALLFSDSSAKEKRGGRRSCGPRRMLAYAASNRRAESDAESVRAPSSTCR